MRRLCLFLDGTWNADSGPGELTNIVLLRNALKPKDTSNVEQIFYYDPGIGTDAGVIESWFQGATGDGLSRNVRQAFKWLCAQYSPGDQIFVFGYSRGAFTARSLAGYVAAVGVFKPEHCTPANEDAAWRYYRTSPADRYPADLIALWRFRHQQEGGPLPSKVHCVAVFDTVGALGVPLTPFLAFNRRFLFHDTRLSRSVEHAFQALAVDERRASFRASVWDRPLHISAQEEHRIQQVWFPGAHGDVGGGLAEKNWPYTALRWVARRACSLGLELDRGFWWEQPPTDVEAPIEQPHLGPAWRLLPPIIRPIAGEVREKPSWWGRTLKVDRGFRAIGESLHHTVLDRMEEMPSYRPHNVVALRDNLVGPAGVLAQAQRSRVGVVDSNDEIMAVGAVQQRYGQLISSWP